MRMTTTYSISLDDVDLALLPVRTRTNDFLKKEHYEFRVMAQDVTTDLHYKCHICALKVPAAYTREHWASVKHQANARIATVASKRIRALVTTPPIVPTTMTSGKFCEACSSIVGINHEKTKEHRIAVIHDRMLVDLMKVYVGNDSGFHDNDDDEKYDDDITIGEARNGFTGSTLDVTIESDTKDDKTETVDENVKITNGDTNNVIVAPIREANEAQVTIIEEENTQTIQNNKDTNGTDKSYMKIETDTYIKLLGNFSGHSEIAFKAVGDKVQIVFDNVCVEVSDDHFHSYYRMKGKIQCRVCCETLNINTEEAHKLTKIHMERVSAAVTDSHCVRKIYDDWSHCIICNQVMKTSAVTAHNLTKNHYERKKMSTTKNTETNQPSKLGNNQIPSTSKVVNTNSISKQPFNSKMTWNTQHDKIEHPYKKTPNPMSVFCVVCQCEVPMKLSNRVDHLKGTRHAYSLKNANKMNPQNA